MEHLRPAVNPAPSPFITAPQAAQLAQTCRFTVVNWCRRWPELGHRVGGRWRINPQVLDRVLRGELVIGGGDHARHA